MALDSETKKASEGGWRDIVTIFVHALIIAFVVRVFLYQPFNIPSGSMQSTLLIGDYLFVSKLSYGYSRYSFPFGLNVFSGRVLGAEPKRGDVAVFKLPRDNSTDYIKRVIGLPGDEISVRRGILYLNAREVPRRRVSDFVQVEQDGRERPHGTLRGDASQRREVQRPRCQAERRVRQCRPLQGAGGSLLHDG